MEASLPFEVIILVISLVANSVLAYVVYKNNPKSATHSIFALLSIVTSLWLIINHITFIPFFSSWSLMLSRLSIFFAVPQVTLFFLLAKTLPKEKIQLNKNKLIALFSAAIVVMGITISPFAFTNVIFTNGSLQPVPGWGMAPFALYVVSLSILSVFLLIKRTHAAIGKEKEQLRFVMLGILVMLGLIIATILIPAVFFQNLFFVPYANFYTLAFLGMTTYAIVRHRLMDIRVFVARSLAYTLVVTIAGTAYTLAIFLSSQLFFRGDITTTQALVYALIALFVALTFQRLKNSLEEVTDKLFFKGKYSSNKLILDLTTIMALTIHLGELTKKTLHQLITTMRISKGAFIIFIKDGEDIITKEGYEESVSYDKEKINTLCEAKRLIIFEEESEGLLKQTMRELGISIALPLYEEGHKEGVLLLGDKKSGEIYSQQDIEVLEILGPEMLVAVQNAKSYEEISKFNVTLRQEVDKATKELREANERLKQLDKLKDEFVSVASHELRTPMTAIKSYLWMALDGRGGPVSEKQKFYLTRAYGSVDRLIRLVNDMLNVSRIDSGRISVELKEVAIDSLTQEVIDEVMPRVNELGLTLNVNPVQSLPHVLADTDKIKEVLFNLIGNAMKFTPKGGTITVSFAQKDDFVETTVSDTGTGIKQEDLPKLFHKFSMVEESFASDKSIQGSGLGLYISKSIVELHKGKIWATSEGHDKGTQFTFSLKVFHEGDLPAVDAPVSNDKQTVGIIHTEI